MLHDGSRQNWQLSSSLQALNSRCKVGFREPCSEEAGSPALGEGAQQLQELEGVAWPVAAARSFAALGLQHMHTRPNGIALACAALARHAEGWRTWKHAEKLSHSIPAVIQI